MKGSSTETSLKNKALAVSHVNDRIIAPIIVSVQRDVQVTFVDLSVWFVSVFINNLNEVTEVERLPCCQIPQEPEINKQLTLFSHLL